MDWLKRIKTIAIASQVASWDLGQGENAVLSFALRNPEYWAIIDDRKPDDAPNRFIAVLPDHRSNSPGKEERIYPLDSRKLGKS